MPQQLNIESTMRAIQPRGSFYTCRLQEMGATKKKGEAERGGITKNKQSFHWCLQKNGLGIFYLKLGYGARGAGLLAPRVQ